MVKENNLLVITNNFPNEDNSYIGDIFVKEQINYIKNYFDNVFVISPIAYGMEYLRKTKQNDYQFDNVKVFFPKYLNNPLFWYYSRSIWLTLETRAVMSLIQKQKLHYDLIHAHYTWPSGAVAVKLRQTIKAPVIITEHTHQTLYKALHERNPYYLNTWKECDAIIRVNNKDIPLIIKCGVDSSKVFSIPNGYNPEKYYFIHKKKVHQLLDLPGDFKFILNISRLYEEKGQKYLISAIHNIVQDRDDIICYIGGIGPLKKYLEKQIISLNLEKNVRMIGFIPDNKINMWMNAADLFVLPSLNEGNPTVMFEALGCGVPFVGTSVGGVPEIITSEKYGLLVEPGNTDDLAEKIMIALDREWDRKAIREYAEQFTWENIARQIVEVYKQVLK